MTEFDQDIERDGALEPATTAALLAHVAKGRWESSLDDPNWVTYEDGSRTLMVAMGDTDEAPWIAFYEVPSTYAFEAHAHHSHYVSYIIAGGVQVGRKWYGPGDIRIQEEGSVYGPEQAGPDGCTMINVFARRKGISPRLLPDGRYYVDPGLVDATITMSEIHDPFGRASSDF